MKKNFIYEVVVRKVGTGLYELKSCSDTGVYARLSVNPRFDDTICDDIGWTLNKHCDMVSVSRETYIVRCYEL